MKNLKNFAIYIVIAFLCVAAYIGYSVWDRPGGSSTGTSSESADTAPAVPAETLSAVDAITTGIVTEKAKDSESHIRELMQKAAELPQNDPIVGIGRGEEYAEVTGEAIDNAGGLSGIVEKGDVVLIKPNICTFAEAGSSRITDYRTVQKIVDIVSALGASRIVIAEGTISGNAFDPAFLKINKYDSIKDAELININGFSRKDCYELKPLSSLTGKALFIPKIYMDADVVINVAKLKTHCDAVVSLSLKNSFGVPPGSIYGVGSKTGLHGLGLNEAIIDINRIRRPDFAVIEGIVGGEGNGPLSNEPVRSGIVFAGRDLAALDSVALSFMGFTVDQVPHVKLAGEEKLGITDIDRIEVVGADLDAIRMKFKMAFGP